MFIYWKTPNYLHIWHNHYQNLKVFFAEIEKSTLHFMRKFNEPQIAEMVFKKECNRRSHVS